MRLVHLRPAQLLTSSDLTRTARSKQFEDRLTASIAAIGLAEPIKVAPLPGGTNGDKRYLIVDGVLRWRAIAELREQTPERFVRIPCYIVDYRQRYEVRYQTDIYQDLLPSQLASLVEHLHQTEHVSKRDIAQYIGVSAATLRNYTGLWRLIQRQGLFARVVDLMDAGALPSSNPYAWLRLTDEGLRRVFEQLSNEAPIQEWIEQQIRQARRGNIRPLPLKFVEAVTGSLPAECYREGERVREMKQQLGLRRGKGSQRSMRSKALPHLDHVADNSPDVVLKAAAHALRAYLQ